MTITSPPSVGGCWSNRLLVSVFYYQMKISDFLKVDVFYVLEIKRAAVILRVLSIELI